MHIHDDTTFTLKNSIRVEFLDDEEALLLDLDKEAIYRLNKTSTCIIKQIINGHNINEIAGILQKYFKGDPATVKNDIMKLITELLSNQIISKNVH